MCIVAIKPAGVQRPTKEMFLNMVERNPDGFGMVTWSPTKGLVVKKTMDKLEYLNWVEQVPDDMPAIFHMRIATHGSVQKKNCHPFIDKDKTWAFAHNGVLSIANEGDMTDSETFFRRLAMPLLSAGKLPGSDMFDKMVECVIGGSKFAFINNKGKLFTYGQYIQHESGLMFSNSSYEEYKIPTFVNSFISQGVGSSRGNYGHAYLQQFDSDKEDKYASCYSDLYDALWYDQGFYQGISVDELYDDFGRFYKLSRKEFREIYDEVMNDIMEESKEFDDNQYAHWE